MWRVEISTIHLNLHLCQCCLQELRDYGGGIPNELVVALERCVGLTARWTGLLPDAYLTYRLYDLQPHVSQTVRSTADPVFSDTTSYPLAVTSDVLHYLRYHQICHIFGNMSRRLDNIEEGISLVGNTFKVICLK